MYGGGRFREIRRFSELDSTNRYLLDEARAGGPDGLVAVTDHQTAGRGRLGRRWEAPAGANLLVSVLLRPTIPIDELHLCTVAMALAARSACRRGAGVECVLKWPNDVMVGEKKLAGILAETIPEGPDPRGSRAVVVGLGVNVRWPPPDGEAGGGPVPEDLGAATSLWRESGRAVEPGDLLDLVLEELDRRLDELVDAGGRQRLASEFRGVCGTLGREVAVSLEGEMVRGRVVDITVEGQLLVDVGACIRTITAGDVVHLRG